MKSVTINVTQGDINKGMWFRAADCPVAIAMMRAIPRASWVLVQTNSVRWMHDFKTWKYKFPRNVARKISNFDIGVKIKPFSFKIHLKDVVQ